VAGATNARGYTDTGTADRRGDTGSGNANAWEYSQRPRTGGTMARGGDTGNARQDPGGAKERKEGIAESRPDRPGGPADGEDTEIADLARLKQRQEAERKAAEDELRAQRAKALEDVAARSGLGGFGLSGASASMRNDTARVQDRNNTLALADLDKRQRDEQFQQVQRDAVLNDLEAAEGVDLDGDGDIAGMTPEEWEKENNPDKPKGGKKEDDRTISGKAVDAVNAVAEAFGVSGGAIREVASTDDLPDGAFKMPRNILEELGLLEFEDAFYMTPDGKLYYVADAAPAEDGGESMTDEQRAAMMRDLRDNGYLDGSAE
jgi:hypothetical protein